EFKSDPKYCKDCQLISQCTQSRAQQKMVTRHIWESYMEQAEDYRHTPKYRDIYKMRGQTIERVFADAKEKHAMRYTQLRSLQKLKMQVALTFACMNLKKLATWKRRRGLLPPWLQKNGILIRFPGPSGPSHSKMAPYALRKVPFLSTV
ncbi:MAG TPA: transposase, partial [Negativicutes bacterium]|nr:transposase [Negativicutes bacterium]